MIEGYPYFRKPPYDWGMQGEQPVTTMDLGYDFGSGYQTKLTRRSEVASFVLP